MQIQIALAHRRPLGAVVASLNFTSVNPDGWSVAYPSPPTFDPVAAPETFAVTRQGFTATGTPTTYSDTLTLTKRVRQPYPNQAQLTPTTVAVSDYVYATDLIIGAANNSTEAAPQPIANWVMADRQMVGNSVALEIVAFHRNARNGEQVACVEFSATDGTTTVTQKVSTSVVSARPSDRNAVIVYRCDLDISTLANPAIITCNAKVYPWVGTAASIRDSAASSVAREFSPRTFTRNTAKFAAPPFAYVSTSGNDTTGIVSTTAATAQATPFATVLGAIKGLKAATAVTGGRIDGCQVRLGSGSFVAGSLLSGDVTGGIQDSAVLTITRDPNIAKSAAILTFGAAALRTRFPYLRIADCSILRTGTLAFQGEAAATLQLTLDDVAFDNVNFNATILNAAALTLTGCDLKNAGSSPLSAGANEVRMLRGLLNDSSVAIENWLVVGCRMVNGNHGTSLFANGTRSSNGAICAFNYLSGFRLAYGSLAETMAVAVVQNVVEYYSATSNTGVGLSADSLLANISHAVVAHNTVAGFFNNGRSNQFYDENPTVPRTHRLVISKANIHVSLNNKGDLFLLDGTRIGNWPYAYGVGVAAELLQFDAASPTFRQEFAGLGSIGGISTTTPLSPQFTTPAHTTTGPTAGAGGGTYTLAAGSPAKGLLLSSVLRYDLAGNPRPAGATSAGAYQ